MINIRRLHCVKTTLGVPLCERYGTRKNSPLGSEQYPRFLRLGLQREWDGRRGGHRGALAHRISAGIGARTIMEFEDPELLVARPVGLITGSGAKGIWRNLQVSIAETQDACV